MATFKLLNSKQVTELTEGALSPAAVLRLARDGVFPEGVVVRIGRKIFFSEQALLDHLAGGGRGLPGGWRKEPKR